MNLCQLASGGQTVKNVRGLTYEFELDQSQRKSSQVNASGWPNETQIERKSKTCVDLRRLASPFGQGFKDSVLMPCLHETRLREVNAFHTE